MNMFSSYDMDDDDDDDVEQYLASLITPAIESCMNNEMSVKHAAAALQQISDVNPEGCEALFCQTIVDVVAKTVADHGLNKKLEDLQLELASQGFLPHSSVRKSRTVTSMKKSAMMTPPAASTITVNFPAEQSQQSISAPQLTSRLREPPEVPAITTIFTPAEGARLEQLIALDASPSLLPNIGFASPIMPSEVPSTTVLTSAGRAQLEQLAAHDAAPSLLPNIEFASPIMPSEVPSTTVLTSAGGAQLEQLAAHDAAPSLLPNIEFASPIMPSEVPSTT
ncbi:hypothetical protein BGZ92_002460, partial [Podila epicladia]